jgi:hypothetical protein
MSTTSAPGSEPEPGSGDFVDYSGTVWRIVEAQHRISTGRLADSLADQQLLEDLAEEAKPVMPAAARGLDYLLATPFRYGYARSSRFRRAHERPGIFYAAESAVTAVAETAYWRLLFLSRSPGMQPPRNTIEHSAYTVRIAADRALDLTRPPFVTARSRWTHSTDYDACQRFAARARLIDAQLIRYESVRDPAAGANIALLDPAGFAEPTPKIVTTYHFRYEGEALLVLAAFPSTERYRFTLDELSR